MSPFEVLYGRMCNTSVSWDNPTDRAVVGLELLREMEEQMSKIKKNLKATQDRQKSYVDKGKTHRKFKVDDHVFLKVKANRSSLKLGKFSKLEVRYCGSFKILERIAPVDCMLALPASMSIHNVYHISLLKKYIWNISYVDKGRFYCGFSAALFLPRFSYHTFFALIFLLHFSVSIIPSQITFHKIDIQ
jgi:hypothetical protein